jgi:hypothetical protein
LGAWRGTLLSRCCCWSHAVLLLEAGRAATCSQKLHKCGREGGEEGALLLHR